MCYVFFQNLYGVLFCRNACSVMLVELPSPFYMTLSFRKWEGVMWERKRRNDHRLALADLGEFRGGR